MIQKWLHSSCHNLVIPKTICSITVYSSMCLFIDNKLWELELISVGSFYLSKAGMIAIHQY